MTVVKRDGYKIISHRIDHRPYHIHIVKDGKELGRFDIENKQPLGKKFKMPRKLKRILKEEGYL